MENELANMLQLFEKTSPQRREVEVKLGLLFPGFYLRYEQVALANVLGKWFPAISSMNVKDLRRLNMENELSDYPMARNRPGSHPQPQPVGVGLCLNVDQIGGGAHHRRP